MDLEALEDRLARVEQELAALKGGNMLRAAAVVGTFVLLAVIVPTGEALAQQMKAPTPYHTILSGTSENLDVIALVPPANAVPAGKRLIIEYVSLKLDLSSGTVPFQTFCEVFGPGPAPSFAPRSHYLTLNERSNGFSASTVTASEPVKSYLTEASTPRISCSIGVTGIPMQLIGWITGQLVDAP